MSAGPVFTRSCSALPSGYLFRMVTPMVTGYGDPEQRFGALPGGLPSGVAMLL